MNGFGLFVTVFIRLVKVKVEATTTKVGPKPLLTRKEAFRGPCGFANSALFASSLHFVHQNFATILCTPAKF